MVCSTSLRAAVEALSKACRSAGSVCAGRSTMALYFSSTAAATAWEAASCALCVVGIAAAPADTATRISSYVVE